MKAALIKYTVFFHAGAQVPLCAMGKSDRQRRCRETANLQVCKEVYVSEFQSCDVSAQHVNNGQ